MIIDGKAIAHEIHEQVRQAIARAPGRKPGLAVILVGHNPASEAYVLTKSRRSKEVGIHFDLIRFDESVDESRLLQEIDRLNSDEHIDGILVQMPLPPHISARKVTLRISPTKDVDGFHPVNVGKMLIGEPDAFLPCTPNGIRELLARSGVVINGKHVVILGRSNIVGKPLAAILIQKVRGCNATVTVAHSHTTELKELCRSADILVAAMGRPHFVTADMVKEGAIVVDVGINRIDDAGTPKGYRLVGDVDFDTVREKTQMITPVPGGVGPMTVAMLIQNTWTSYLRRQTADLTESMES